MKILKEQQKKLQASSTRIEEMLQEITTSKADDDKRTNIPRALSACKLTDLQKILSYCVFRH